MDLKGAARGSLCEPAGPLAGEPPQEAHGGLGKRAEPERAHFQEPIGRTHRLAEIDTRGGDIMPVVLHDPHAPANIGVQHAPNTVGDVAGAHVLAVAVLAGPIRGAQVERLRAIVHACILLFLCGCATSHSLKAQEDSKFQNLEHQEASGERVAAPTWTLEFALPQGEEGSDGGTEEPADQLEPSILDGRPVRVRMPHADGLPPHGPLLKATFTGPINEAWRSSSDGLTGAETHAAIEKADKAAPSSGCALGLGFWLAVGLGLLAFGGWIWLKRSLP